MVDRLKARGHDAPPCKLYTISVMVLRLGNDIFMPGGLHIQHVRGRNKTHNSRLVMDIWGEGV